MGFAVDVCLFLKLDFFTSLEHNVDFASQHCGDER